MLRNWIIGLSLFLFALGGYAQQAEPPLRTTFQKLGLKIAPSDEIKTSGIMQGLFRKTVDSVEVILIAQSSIGTQETIANVRVGYYSTANPSRKHLLFECGHEWGEQCRLSGLPAQPRGPYFFQPPQGLFGFYVQNSNFNPEFSGDEETVTTQDALNRKMSRFGNDAHKVLLFPYKDEFGIKSDWFVLCWEFSNNNDYQDLITVVRGVAFIPSLPVKKERSRDMDFRPRITLFWPLPPSFHQ